MRDDRLYLIHILEAIQRIEAYTSDGPAAFAESPMVQDAVIRNFEVMGEAVKRVSPSVRDAYPAVPWRRIAGFRDVLIHDYAGVSIAAVWAVVEQDLPGLRVSRRMLFRPRIAVSRPRRKCSQPTVVAALFGAAAPGAPGAHDTFCGTL